ncbi:MAG: type II toxin-antitoxin system VapC family toxin [Pyrinomonadaceae bacterium]
MGIYFFDSSALVKRYASEAGTAWLISITDPAAANSIYISRITGAEVIAAITRKVRNVEVTASD